jgi:hypothetical protein
MLPGGPYENPIPARFLAPIDCLKIPAQVTISGWESMKIKGTTKTYYPYPFSEMDRSPNISNVICMYCILFPISKKSSLAILASAFQRCQKNETENAVDVQK